MKWAGDRLNFRYEKFREEGGRRMCTECLVGELGLSILWLEMAAPNDPFVARLTVVPAVGA